jgi:hypothetical protein
MKCVGKKGGTRVAMCGYDRSDSFDGIHDGSLTFQNRVFAVAVL